MGEIKGRRRMTFFLIWRSFALLAHDVLASGGVVCGAAWDPGFKGVRHVLAETEDGLDAVMRSKYVQSKIGCDVYEGMRVALRGGKRLLFTGTACQVAGVRAYLGRLADSDAFLAVDVICHGVPSPLLWEKWVTWRERRACAPLRGVNMRSETGVPSATAASSGTTGTSRRSFPTRACGLRACSVLPSAHAAPT